MAIQTVLTLNFIDFGPPPHLLPCTLVPTFKSSHPVQTFASIVYLSDFKSLQNSTSYWPLNGVNFLSKWRLSASLFQLSVQIFNLENYTVKEYWWPTVTIQVSHVAPGKNELPTTGVNFGPKW